MELGKALGKQELAAALVSAGLVSLEDIAKALEKSKGELARAIVALGIS